MRLLLLFDDGMLCIGEVIRNAGDAVFNQVLSEVDEQAQPAVHQTQVGEQLLLMDAQDGFSRLEFENQFSIDDVGRC